MPVPRVIGRILSLGVPMPGPLVDNYNVLSAPSFFDYDAIVVEPRVMAQLVDEVASGAKEAKTFAGSPVRLRPDQPGDVALIDVLRRRRDETRRLLDNGGLVIAFLQPPTTHRIDGEELDSYGWLPLPEGVTLRPPHVLPGEGTRAHVVDATHPLAAFVIAQLANVSYRSHVDRDATPGVRVFAQSHGGAAIGVELPLPRGRLVLLPALRAMPSGNARYDFSERLQQGVRRALGAIAPGRPPLWVKAHPLPGLDERARALDDAKKAADAAAAALAEAEAAHEELAKYQRLLWQEGALGLGDVVLDALRLIGDTVYASHEGGPQAKVDGKTVLIEIEASEHPIDLAPHYRLRERIERAIAKWGDAPRGIVFVNGERLRPPAERTHVIDALRTAAETMRYALAPTPGLYDAVVAQLSGDDAAVAAYRQRLISTDGLLT